MWTALAKARDGALTRLGDALGEESDGGEDTVSQAGSDESTGSHFLAESEPEEEAALRWAGAPSPATALLDAAAARGGRGGGAGAWGGERGSSG